MRDSDAGEQQPEVIVDFRRRADRRTRRSRGVALPDGDGRGNAEHFVDIGFFDAFQKLAGVCGKRFDISSLAFGVDGVEGERGFPEPLTPVTIVSALWGISKSMFLRL